MRTIGIDLDERGLNGEVKSCFYIFYGSDDASSSYTLCTCLHVHTSLCFLRKRESTWNTVIVVCIHHALVQRWRLPGDGRLKTRACGCRARYRSLSSETPIFHLLVLITPCPRLYSRIPPANYPTAMADQLVSTSHVVLIVWTAR